MTAPRGSESASSPSPSPSPNISSVLGRSLNTSLQHCSKFECFLRYSIPSTIHDIPSVWTAIEYDPMDGYLHVKTGLNSNQNALFVMGC